MCGSTMGCSRVGAERRGEAAQPACLGGSQVQAPFRVAARAKLSTPSDRAGRAGGSRVSNASSVWVRHTLVPGKPAPRDPIGRSGPVTPVARVGGEAAGSHTTTVGPRCPLGSLAQS